MRLAILLVILATFVLNALQLPTKAENLSQPAQDQNAGQQTHQDPAPGPAPVASIPPASDSTDTSINKSGAAAPAPSPATPTPTSVSSFTSTPTSLPDTKPPSIMSPSMDYAINGPAPSPAPGPQETPRELGLGDACNAAIDHCKPGGPNGQQPLCCGWDGIKQHTSCVLEGTKARCAYR